MNMYAVTIDKRIVVEENEEVIFNGNLFLFEWICAYLLQYVADSISIASSKDQLQSLIEDYCYLINNSDSFQKVLPPVELRDVITSISTQLSNNGVIEIVWKENHISLLEEDVQEIFSLIYEDFLEPVFNFRPNSMIHLSVSDEYGTKFASFLYETFTEAGETVCYGPQSGVNDMVVVCYADNPLFDNQNDNYENRTIYCGSDFYPGIPFTIKRNGQPLVKYMYFPIWKEGDAVELSFEMEKEKIVISGKHINSLVTTKMII